MGGAPSVSTKPLEPVVIWPAYYTTAEATDQDLLYACSQFNLIATDQAKGYSNVSSDDVGHTYGSAVILFFDVFYERLFSQHPSSATLFSKGMECQGNALVQMLQIALGAYKNDKVFDEVLISITEYHYQRGVKSYEYNIVGEVLLFSLERVLGSDFTLEAQTVWIKIYSRMLKVILPVAAELEFYSPVNLEHISTLLPPAPPQEVTSNVNNAASDVVGQTTTKVVLKALSEPKELELLDLEAEQHQEPLDTDRENDQLFTGKRRCPASKNGGSFSSMNGSASCPSDHHHQANSLGKKEYLKVLCQGLLVSQRSDVYKEPNSHQETTHDHSAMSSTGCNKPELRSETLKRKIQALS